MTSLLLRRAPAWVLVALAVSACGARTGLFDDGQYAAGGSGQGGSTQSTSTQGGSGGQAACTVLALHEPVIAAELDGEVTFDDGLQLTASSDDGAQVTAVWVRQHQGQSNAVYHATFEPWKSWPAGGELTPVHPTDIFVIDTPAAALSPGNRFSFAARSGDVVFLFPALDPAVGGQDFSGEIALPGADASFAAPRKGAMTGPTHLVGTFESTFGQMTGTLLSQDGTVFGDVSLGCSSVQPASAGGVPFGDGWIVAVSSGSPDAPGCQTMNPGLPQRVDLLAISPDGSASVLASIPAGVVLSVALAPHPEGAYVAWRESTEGIAVIRGARVDGETGTLVGPMTLSVPGEQPSGLVVAAVGSSLAVARRSDESGAPSGLVIGVHDEALGQTALTVTTPPAGSLGPSSAYGSPDGKGLLVAWTSIQPKPERVHIARFDCAK